MKTYLSARFFAAFSIWMMVGVLGIEFPFLLIVYAVSAVLLAIVTLQDRRTLPSAGSLDVVMTVPSVVELDNECFIDVTLERDGSAFSGASRYQVSFNRLACLTAQRRATPLKSTRWGGLAARATFRSHRLGQDTIDGLFVEMVSSFGFWYGRVWKATPASRIHIVPSRDILSDAKFSEMLSRQRLLLTGSRLRVRSSTPDQYYSSRRYQYPDSIRFIDWKKSAKTGLLHSKVFDNLFKTKVVLAFDLGRGMLGQIRRSMKRDYYWAAGHVLAEHALKQGDLVAVLGFSNRPLFSLPRVTSPAELAALAGQPQADPREVATDFSILQTEIPRLSSRRSIVIIFTDAAYPSVQEEVLTAIRILGQKHMVVVLSMIDGAYHLASAIDTVDPGHLTAESYQDLLYLYWLNDSFSNFSSRVDSNGAAALSVPERYWLDVCGRVYDRLRVSMRL